MRTYIYCAMLEFIKTAFVALVALVKFMISNRLLKRFPPPVRPIVEVRQGKLRGVTSTLPNGSSYHYFKGIPYAKPPVGNLRFQPPVPIDKFYSTVVDCLLDRSMCIQPAAGSFLMGKEGGLFLNIYTPQLPGYDQENPKLPVMVWIHGGGFTVGSGDSFVYDPVCIVQEGVIVVTMNYRLGPFGFLSLPSAGVVGNAGLKDQLLVFRWVNENITRFGGDPGNVTVFGESAGSMSAYLHYLSSNSRKYFHRVICQSGVACSESFFQTNAADRARKLAKCLGYEGNDDRQVLETLLQAPAKLILKHRNDILTDQEKRLAMQMLFRPVIEKEFTEDSIITEPPEKILKSFDTLRMPLINGCTSGEGLLGVLMIKGRLKDFDREPDRLVPQLMGSPAELDKSVVGKEIKRFYFGDKRIDKSTLNELSNLMSDNIFITNTMVSAEWIAKYQPNVRHYHYRFSYDGKFSVSKRLFNLSHLAGACHGDDIFYLFKSKMLPSLPESSDECRVRNLLIRLWTNFAKYDDPTPDQDDPLVLCKWSPVETVARDADTFNIDCLEINTQSRMIRNPYEQRIQLWRQYLKTYRKGFLSCTGRKTYGLDPRIRTEGPDPYTCLDLNAKSGPGLGPDLVMGKRIQLDPRTGPNQGAGPDPGTGSDPGAGPDPGTGPDPGAGPDPGTGPNSANGLDPGEPGFRRSMIAFIRAVYRLVLGTGKHFVQNQFDKLWPTKVRPVVQVTQGKVRGITRTLPNGSQYSCFRGIPYAKPPVGELRFKSPVALEKFNVPIIDCASDGDVFIQFNMFLPTVVVGSEKALHLNVYTPVPVSVEKNNNPHLPVMIYIHGGGYVSGSGSSFMFDPVHLVQEGVVVVLMNYRLGPLGFLSLPSMGIAGNAGLKDQLLAFKWVHENIEQFGGDSKNVTIFGESAGSWSTFLHYLSQNSRKYFNRAICQSGVVCTESFFQVDPAGKARKLAKALGYQGNCDVGVYETLMKAPARLIVKYQEQVATEEEKELAMNYLFRPVIEESQTEDSIITSAPEKILKDFDTIKTTIITGCNSSEGTLALYCMNQKNQKNAFDKEPQRLVPCFLKENPAINCMEVGQEIKQFYLGAEKFTRHTRKQMCDLMSDVTFITTTMISAEWLAKYQPNVRHYHYRFSYHGRFSLYKGFFNLDDVDGASHGDDTFYVFDSPLLPSLPTESNEWKVRSNLVKLWTNFAKYDNPTPVANSDDPLPVQWPPVQRLPGNSDQFHLDCLEIGADVCIIQNPDRNRIEFWRDMLDRHRSGFL
ncbi:uncharacterized protein LOC131687876 [Topomyia yanbarensis]|uniref:uncharacterized protein LOC131687876 n=1 Tax=Topomyia yanbarensis TaxID=2498891 RepID=UPI00273C9E80|nr:uncharacterized protein LOC131687876 [Topomyia yanbarensis]